MKFAECMRIIAISIGVAVLTALLGSGIRYVVKDSAPTAVPVETPAPTATPAPVVSPSTAEVSALRATTKKVIDDANDPNGAAYKKELEEAIKELDESAVMMAKGGKNFTLVHVSKEQMANTLKDMYQKRGFKVETSKWLPNNYLVEIKW